MVPYRYPRIIFRRQEEKSRAEPESVGGLSNFFLLDGLLQDSVDVSWLLRSKLSVAGQQQMEKSSSM